MSETSSNPATPGDESIASVNTAAADNQQMQLQVDDANANVTYSSTTRVWGSAEEINIDFGGGIRPTQDQGVARLKIDQRLIMSPWGAKRLALALQQTIQRYEQTYGPLELDERKRRNA